ncbi:hypothetical protein WOLCODRAFT_135281 [Wolfiporia cocos MD-104 SS10]|uniref:DUF6534 domain-containing protein n=1 Tax=Wolfiporia cocos (strain MD-104) TaxID=742152 RepID=A0A2H3JAN3_WOLCO|nr:hypothetical protein WOLCODRAFT_135281 [Wolfiporia cocos MD-104 SS10]
MPSLNLNESLGCVFIGILLAIALYGVSLAQTMYYFRRYPKDSWALKGLVVLLWAIDTSRTAMAILLTWFYVVSGHGNVLVLDQFPTTYFGSEFALSTLSILVVQLYYVASIWRFLRNKWYKNYLTATFLIFALLSFGSGLANVLSFTETSNIGSAVWDTRVPAILQHAATFTTDVYISVALSLILNKSRTGLGRTNYMITQLVMYGITRGVLTALLQFLQLVTFAEDLKANPPILLWALFHFVDGAAYTNSLMALLNMRAHILQGGSVEAADHFSVEIPMRPVRPSTTQATAEDIALHQA